MTKSRMIVIDVRSTNEFKRGALPESINIPFSKAFQFGETGMLYRHMNTYVITLASLKRYLWLSR